MLAAVALLPQEQVNQSLTTLAKRGLVTSEGAQRYRLNLLPRELAQRYFKQKYPYVQEAARILLARYCLDLAHDLDPEAAQAEPPQNEKINEKRIEQFRSQLRPELSHVQRVIVWAAEQCHWDLLRRFAYVPSLDVVDRLSSNGFEIRLWLQMGLVREPIIYRRGNLIEPRAERLLVTTGWSVVKDDSPNLPAPRSKLSGSLSETEQERHPKQRCELNLRIASGRIIDGIFDDMVLTDAWWAGVLAHNLTCKLVDMVRAQLIACDLRGSVLLACDARHASLHKSSLQHALLRETNLRGADLRNVDFTGAVLEIVDLRGADLSGARFVGATLEDVDLRDAVLTGACFDGARLTRVKLLGCRLGGSTWAEVSLESYPPGEDTIYKEILELTKKTRSELLPENPGYRRKTLRALKEDKTSDPVDCFRGDLRAADLRSEPSLAKAVLREADLRAAHLSGVDLRQAELTEANLRAAVLSKAMLSGARLDAADLRAAVFEYAELSEAILNDAMARLVGMHKAMLCQATLSGADLREADLSEADLSGADLQRAVLTSVNLRGAKLDGALLRDAICDGTDFSHSNVTNEQLATVLRLDNAIMPNGECVKLFAEHYDSQQALEQLRFAQCSGTFVRVNLDQRDLFAVRLVRGLPL